MTPDEKELSRFEQAKNLNQAQLDAMNWLRIEFRSIAECILIKIPASADRSAAMRYLRLAHMQVNAAICHDWPDEPSSNP